MRWQQQQQQKSEGTHSRDLPSRSWSRRACAHHSEYGAACTLHSHCATCDACGEFWRFGRRWPLRRLRSLRWDASLALASMQASSIAAAMRRCCSCEQRKKSPWPLVSLGHVFRLVRRRWVVRCGKVRLAWWRRRWSFRSGLPRAAEATIVGLVVGGTSGLFFSVGT